MVIKQINNKDMLNFKVIGYDKNYNKHTIYFYRTIGIRSPNLNDIEKVYYDKESNKRLFIKFKNDNVLKTFYIKELELI